MFKVSSSGPLNSDPFPEEQPAASVRDPKDSIYFKSDRMYAHRLIRFNYTTYDVRRAQDVVNPRTSHCNIMLLNKVVTDVPPDDTHSSKSSTTHPFLYGRVIGIYHVNAIYTGPGMVNYNPTRFDFLWVRWYEHKQISHGLDELVFPPIADVGAFGFVDPADVLRSSHIIPAFNQGVRRDAVGMSKCAHDSGDFNAYYVGR